MMTWSVNERTDWRNLVEPKHLRAKPIHRWYVFPHSFTDGLVHALVDEWHLTPEDHILDPFVGAGTTLLAAKARGIPATGFDLSPLAVLAARVKTADYDVARLERLWSSLQERIEFRQWGALCRDYPELVRHALPEKVLLALETVDQCISKLSAPDTERGFFRLALLSAIPAHSRAVATGGWLKWVDRRSSASKLLADFHGRVEAMLEELATTSLPRGNYWQVRQGDARSLPEHEAEYTAVITSPPYPNRHDYTRVFGVELMFAFLDWEQTRELRYQSFHSHPEARPTRPSANGYQQPDDLSRVITRIQKEGEDHRVLAMIEGYFTDMYLVLRETQRVCKPGSPVGFVVGNAQYRGVPVAVDELTADVGEQAGLRCEKIIAARYRGNSAQQMAKYGRSPSRESVVVFRVPCEGGRRTRRGAG